MRHETPPLIPKGVLPAYLAEIFGELYQEDGMLVMGRGLQSDMLLAALVRFYADTEEGHWALLREEQQQEEDRAKRLGKNIIRNSALRRKKPLVLVLGLSREHERVLLLDILTSWGTSPDVMPTILTNEAGQSSERAILYQTGGVFVVTSRILIVDLLTSVLQAKDIDGVVVAHAEQVTDTSTEAFILRIIQTQRYQHNGEVAHENLPPAFCKAISDAPEKLFGGYLVDKILKNLYVRRLYLYPRFHASIREELEGKNPPKVIELHQELSPAQKEMQQAIAVAVQACIRELKSSATSIDWTGTESESAVDAILSTDRAVSRQLENDWHRLSPQTKQLVQDLRTLRTLFQNLLLYDCVSFYKLLMSIQAMSAASRHPSLWLLTPAADVLFTKAKERVYHIQRWQSNEANGDAQARLHSKLEENPKWRLLKEILDEIRKEHEGSEDGCAIAGPRNVLIMVKDERSMESVRDFLVHGRRTIWLRWLRYLEHYNDRSRSQTSNTVAMSEESRLLLEEEGRARRILFGRNRTTSGFKPSSKRSDDMSSSIVQKVPNYVRKRRRIAIEKSRGLVTHQPDDLEREAVLNEAVEKTEREIMTRDPADPEDGEPQRKELQIFGSDSRFSATFPDELRVVVKNYANTIGDQASMLLQDLQPTHIILYDTDVAFVRTAEIFSALSTTPVKVYFFMFASSSEEKLFKTTLKREQNAFEKLIQHKKTMPLPAFHTLSGTQEIQQALQHGTIAGTYQDGKLPLSVDTRTGRGKTKQSKDRRNIAVDVREFRSALPSALHQNGFRLAPVTLIVGDFVLSSVHCIERKSISDLYGSFASGRLYTQAESMVKHYKVPCLLIEFDPAKTFSLQNVNELGVDIRSDSICSKMTLLTMHFPRLRILWARSPFETVKIFKELKKNHDEVDVEKAVQVGRNESEELLLNPESEEEEVNEAAREMLLRLPGVNTTIARKIMEGCECLADLIEMTRDELRELVGPSTGQKLFTFFRQKMSAADRP